MQAPIYQDLADSVEATVRSGMYAEGDRMPSIRGFSQERGVSISTSVRTFHELERRGVVRAAPRSGYFAVAPDESAELPAAARISAQPMLARGGAEILKLLEASQDPGVMDFATARPAMDMIPDRELQRASRQVWKVDRRRSMALSFPPGIEALRVQVAKRLAKVDCRISPDELIITQGCQAAIALALRLLTEPGDIVAVEAPTHYGILELLEQLGLKALPIPTDPAYGISMNALELACQQWPVKAFIVVPHFSNPLGYCMYDVCKQRIVDVARRYDVAVIEDDVFGELRENHQRPSPVKCWDHEGHVYYCGSVSKTFGSGFRVGWLSVPPDRMQQAREVQYAHTVTVDVHAQLVTAELLKNTNIDRFLNHASAEYNRRTATMARRVEDSFPIGTRISRPRGGYLLWVELSGCDDTASVLDEALSHGVAFAPGGLFTVDQQFKNCLRLNACEFNTRAAEKALFQLARLLS
ncbi:PLP-dependent aminotransferase family protein [Chromohalobacter sp. 48-RD10]|uniref:aminotransferase-like domain-containing protein n=1 Tax=Chromohalobacter sp. 48-RD10 TaxID=2994063 RepID=UPI00246954A9|nr:PLP-dependent aminotransferase family protein [Chromohalobacter sp. 48-RD10]